MNNKTRNIFVTIVGIILVASIGSIFVSIGMNWFQALEKPTQWIPNFVIPIVWTVIYVTFAIILTIWQGKENLPKNIVIQLILNGIFNILWCLVFFTLNQLLIGNIIIIINLILAFKLVIDISKEQKVYGLILSIYPLWLSIATTLNLAVWILN